MAHIGRINQTDQVSEHRSDRPESPDRTDDRSKGLTDLYHYYLQSSLLLVGLGVGSEQWSRQDTATMQIKFGQNNQKMVNSCRPFTVQPIE